MKRLLLISAGLAYIKTFVRADPTQLKMLFIPTAGNLDKNPTWIDKDRAVLSDMRFAMTELDIETASKSQVAACLDNIDIVYVAGGHTFHLLHQVRKSGFDTVLTNFVQNGGLYAGASAGALLAGTDIGPAAPFDDPTLVSDLASTAALKFVDFVPLPHCNEPVVAKALPDILHTYADAFEIIPLTDDQAIVVEDDTWNIVASPRSRLELEWDE